MAGNVIWKVAANALIPKIAKINPRRRPRRRRRPSFRWPQNSFLSHPYCVRSSETGKVAGVQISFWEILLGWMSSKMSLGKWSAGCYESNMLWIYTVSGYKAVPPDCDALGAIQRVLNESSWQISLNQYHWGAPFYTTDGGKLKLTIVSHRMFERTSRKFALLISIKT